MSSCSGIGARQQQVGKTSASSQLWIQLLRRRLPAAGAAVEADEFADGAEGEDEAAGETEEYEEEEEATRLVYADEAADFGFPFVVEAEEGELTEVVATVAAGDFEVEHETDLDLPLNELVSGKVRQRIGAGLGGQRGAERGHYEGRCFAEGSQCQHRSGCRIWLHVGAGNSNWRWRQRAGTALLPPA